MLPRPRLASGTMAWNTRPALPALRFAVSRPSGPLRALSRAQVVPKHRQGVPRRSPGAVTRGLQLPLPPGRRSGANVSRFTASYGLSGSRRMHALIRRLSVADGPITGRRSGAPGLTVPTGRNNRGGRGRAERRTLSRLQGRFPGVSGYHLTSWRGLVGALYGKGTASVSRRAPAGAHTAAQGASGVSDRGAERRL